MLSAHQVNLLLVLSFPVVQWGIQQSALAIDHPYYYDGAIMDMCQLLGGLLLAAGCWLVLLVDSNDWIGDRRQCWLNAKYMVPPLAGLTVASNWLYNMDSSSGSSVMPNYTEGRYQLLGLAPVVLWVLICAMDINIAVPPGADLIWLLLCVIGRSFSLLDPYLSERHFQMAYWPLAAATICVVARLAIIGKEVGVHGSPVEMVLFAAVASAAVPTLQLFRGMSFVGLAPEASFGQAAVLVTHMALLAGQTIRLILIVTRLGTLPAAVELTLSLTFLQLLAIRPHDKHHGLLGYAGLGMALVGSAVYLVRATKHVRLQVLQQQPIDAPVERI